ncbi:MAG: YbaB/EbfC family nucleoid-associated protein [Chloroflexi bacterium]|nr:YbaB/EbfC family nucleoid-associated protein [Chloroflexota bacterium]
MNRDMLRQAQKLQARLTQAQAELESATVEGSAGGGAITVTVTGQQKVTAVKVSPEALEGADREMLEDLILAAVNDALDKARDLAAQRLGAITGGLNIPGLM